MQVRDWKAQHKQQCKVMAVLQKDKTKLKQVVEKRRGEREGPI